MARKDYSEDVMIQAPAADLLAQQLGWDSVFAHHDEDFGPDSLLGRQDDTEVVLTREVLAALRRLNPGLPEDAYRDALAQVVRQDITERRKKPRPSGRGGRAQARVASQWRGG